MHHLALRTQRAEGFHPCYTFRNQRCEEPPTPSSPLPVTAGLPPLEALKLGSLSGDKEVKAAFKKLEPGGPWPANVLVVAGGEMVAGGRLALKSATQSDAHPPAHSIHDSNWKQTWLSPGWMIGFGDYGSQICSSIANPQSFMQKNRRKHWDVTYRDA